MKRCLSLFTSLPKVGGHTTITLGLCALLKEEFRRILVLTRDMPGHGRCEASAKKLADMGCEVVDLQMLSSVEIGWRALTEWGRPDCFISMHMRNMGPLFSLLLCPKLSVNYQIAHDMTESNARYVWLCSFFFTQTIFISPETQRVWQQDWGAGRKACSISQPAEIGLDHLAECKRNGPIAFGFVGRLSEGKGSKVMIEFVKSCPVDAELLVAGAGEYEGEFAKLAGKPREPGRVQVRYLGAFSALERRQFLQKFFSCVDYLVVASQDEWEGMPTVILEALQAGVPVLATRSGGTRALGFPEYVSPTAGCVQLVEKEDVVKTLRSLVSEPRPSEQTKRACAELFERKFSNSAIRSMWLAALK